MTTNDRDPGRAGASHTGLELLREMLTGGVPMPPMARLTGIRVAEADRGRVVLATSPGVDHYNHLGIVHGGFTSTLLDSGMSCAVLSQLGAGASLRTMSLNIVFLRPSPPKSASFVARAASCISGGGWRAP